MRLKDKKKPKICARVVWPGVLSLDFLPWMIFRLLARQADLMHSTGPMVPRPSPLKEVGSESKSQAPPDNTFPNMYRRRAKKRVSEARPPPDF